MPPEPTWRSDLLDSIFFWTFVVAVCWVAVWACGCAYTRVACSTDARPDITTATFVQGVKAEAQCFAPMDKGHSAKVTHTPYKMTEVFAGVLGAAISAAIQLFTLGEPADGGTVPAELPATPAPPLLPIEATMPMMEAGGPLWMAPPMQWSQLKCGGSLAPAWCLQ